MTKRKRKSRGSVMVAASLEFTKNNIARFLFAKEYLRYVWGEKKQNKTNKQKNKWNKTSVFPNCLIQHELYMANLKGNSKGLFILSERESFQQRNNLAKIFKELKVAIAINCDFEINTNVS